MLSSFTSALASCRLLLAAALTAATALSAQAGYVTTQQAGLDAIFSQQTAFDGRPIEIRFNAAQTLFSNALLDVDTEADMNSILLPSSVRTINMYFVDSISWCGSVSASIVGCAWTGANGLVLESSVADDGNFVGANLIAHELLHNLGLDHFGFDDQNLMAPILMSGMGTLNSAQVDLMLLSPFVQTDTSGQRFIAVTPYAVLAEPAIGVPEPSSLALAGLGLALAWRSRRSRRV